MTTLRDDSSFDHIASAYALLVDEKTRWKREQAFFRHWITGASVRVLDLGCGTGFHARHIAEHFTHATVCGADPSASMLKIAQSTPGSEHVNQWVPTSAEHPPGGPFDVVLLLGNTLSLIEDVSPVFEAAARVTGPHGCFIFQMLDYETMYEQNPAPRQTVRSDARVTIEKTLTLHSPGDHVAADLHLVIRPTGDTASTILAEESHLLYTHPTAVWEPAAARAGWTVEHVQSTYDVPPANKTGDQTLTVGQDRILVLRRNQY